MPSVEWNQGSSILMKGGDFMLKSVTCGVIALICALCVFHFNGFAYNDYANDESNIHEYTPWGNRPIKDDEGDD